MQIHIVILYKIQIEPRPYLAQLLVVLWYLLDQLVHLPDGHLRQTQLSINPHYISLILCTSDETDLDLDAVNAFTLSLSILCGMCC